jgi:hypothetical protein
LLLCLNWLTGGILRTCSWWRGLKGQGLNIKMGKCVLFDRPRLGEGPPAVEFFFFYCHFNTIQNSQILSRLTPKLLNLHNSFEDGECMQYSLLNFTPFLLIGRKLSRIFTKLFSQAVHGCLPLFKRVICKSEKYVNQ